MPSARFFFDAGSGHVLWSEHGPVELAELPISELLRTELTRLIGWYDTSLNWSYPPDPGPWREPECRRFNEAVRTAVARLRQELGAAWTVRDECTELHEDPELDAYLADPANFRRG